AGPITPSIAGVIGSRAFDAQSLWGADCNSCIMAKEPVSAAIGEVLHLASRQPAKLHLLYWIVNGLGRIIPFTAILSAHDAEVMAVFNPFPVQNIRHIAARNGILAESQRRVGAPIIRMPMPKIMTQ